MTKVFMLLMVLILVLSLLLQKRYKDANVFTFYEKNYRSTKPILDLATKVIEFNERVYEKNLKL